MSGRSRWWRWLPRTAREIRAEVEEEIRFHLEMRTAELERHGWRASVAREEALRRFGDVRETEEICAGVDRRKERTMRRRERWRELVRDMDFGVRQLWRRPGFAVAAILTLAVGIGATTVVFTAADHVLLRPLPYREADRVVTLWETSDAVGEGQREVSPGNFLDWRERATSFQAVALAEPFSVDLTGGERPEPLNTWLVTEGFFEALGASPILGRPFAAEEHLPNSELVIILSHHLWQQRFGSDAGIIGRVVEVDRLPARVVGVMPRGIEYPERTEVWAPKSFPDYQLSDRASAYMHAVARLRPGFTLEAARDEMRRIGAELSAEHPTTNTGVGVAVVPLTQALFGNIRAALFILLGAVGFVLLIACANVAGLLLARGAERERELGVRAALGAGKGRLVRQLLTESLVLGLFGGALGVGGAWLGTVAVRRLIPSELPRVDTIALDTRVVMFALTVTLATTLVFGLAPALRQAGADVAGTLRSGGRAGLDRAHTRLRGGIVIGEIALALMLLIGASLLARSFLNLRSSDLGFRTDGIATLQLFLYDTNATAQQRLDRTAQLIERFEGVPGVAGAAVVSALPFHPEQIDATDQLIIEGRPALDNNAVQRTYTTVVSPNYFRLMGIPLRAGRDFTDADRGDSPRVAMINEALARRFFPDEDPIGKRITVGVMSPPASWEIVGVVGDVRPTTFDSDPRPELYVPHAQSGTGSVTFVARTRGDAAQLLSTMQAIVWEEDPQQSVYYAATLDSLLGDTLRERRFHLSLLGLFSLIALSLSCIGIYGVVAVSTNQRMHEMGVRMALGARPSQVVALVARQGVVLGVPGVLIGLTGALALTRSLSGMLYGIESTDPATFAQLAILMLVVAILGAYLPARRAAGADPVRALRAD